MRGKLGVSEITEQRVLARHCSPIFSDPPPEHYSELAIGLQHTHQVAHDAV